MLARSRCRTNSANINLPIFLNNNNPCHLMLPRSAHHRSHKSTLNEDLRARQISSVVAATHHGRCSVFVLAQTWQELLHDGSLMEHESWRLSVGMAAMPAIRLSAMRRASNCLVLMLEYLWLLSCDGWWCSYLLIGWIGCESRFCKLLPQVRRKISRLRVGISRNGRFGVLFITSLYTILVFSDETPRRGISLSY